MRNMLTGDNPARAGEDSYGKSEAIMIPPKGTGPLLKQRLWLYFCSRVIWNDNDWMYMYRQAQMRILRFFYNCRKSPARSGEWFDSIPHFLVHKST